MRILNWLVDERFFAHRRKSTSAAGIACAELALLLFMYRYYVKHVVSWDLFAVGATFVVVKLALMTYYYLTD
jgi:accessory gene regulator protein AgrB